MKRLSLAAAALLLAAPACYTKSSDAPSAASSFRVQIKGLYPATAVASTDGVRAPLPVEPSCAAKYSNDQTKVPAVDMYVFKSAFDYANAAAVGTILLVIVAIVIVPYLVHTHRQDKR